MQSVNIMSFYIHCTVHWLQWLDTLHSWI